MTGRFGTSLITSSQPLMLLLAVFVYDPLTWIVSLFLAADGCRCQAFYHAGPTVWNSLPDELRKSDGLIDLNDSWKQFFSAVTSVTSALEVFWRDALYKSTVDLRFTHLVTCSTLFIVACVRTAKICTTLHYNFFLQICRRFVIAYVNFWGTVHNFKRTCIFGFKVILWARSRTGKSPKHVR